MNEYTQPRMLTVRQVAATGIMPEHALRLLIKQNRIPYIMVGSKALINYTALCSQLQDLKSAIYS
jgi:hypothetical protein